MRLQQPARDFWRSTPARVTAFFRVNRERVQAEDYRAGVIAALVANANRRKGAKAASPGDFFPSLARKRPRGPMSGDQIRDALLQAFDPTGEKRAAQQKGGRHDHDRHGTRSG